MSALRELAAQMRAADCGHWADAMEAAVKADYIERMGGGVSGLIAWEFIEFARINGAPPTWLEITKADKEKAETEQAARIGHLPARIDTWMGKPMEIGRATKWR